MSAAGPVANAHCVDVTFDEVMHAMRSTRNKMACVDFSFRAGDERHYAVTAWGEPSVRGGMTVTAVLRHAGDWQSLIGWVDHETGEVCCKPWSADLGALAVLPITWIFAATLTPTTRVGAVLVALLGILGFLACAWELRLTRSAAKFLRARGAAFAAARGNGQPAS